MVRTFTARRLPNQMDSSSCEVAIPVRLPGWLFTTTWVLWLAGRRLLHEGMWGDGLVYAAISRNLSIGVGSFWAPFFSHAFWLPYNTSAVFYEHPPLLFGIQAVFFKVLGDSFFTEKLYCAVVIGLTIWLIVRLWRQLLPVTHPLRALDWLPVFCWYSTYITEWTYGNNMLDCTMSLFCLLSVYWLILGWQSGRNEWLWSGLGAVALVLAVLTKGPVGLHVLAVPVAYGILYQRPIQPVSLVRRTLVLSCLFAAGLGFVLLYEPARHALQTYADQQVLAALASKRENMSNNSSLGRFWILATLLINLLPILLLGGALAYSQRTRLTDIELRRVRWFWLAIGLATTLPLALSVKQYVHYLVPAMPYLALGLAMWIGPNLLATFAKLPNLLRYIRPATWVGVLACLAVCVNGWRTMGTPFWVERPMLHEMHIIGKHMPPTSRLGVCQQIMTDFYVHSYLQRYYRIELTTPDTHPGYVILDKTCQPGDERQLLTAGYRRIPTDLRRYVLYTRDPSMRSPTTSKSETVSLKGHL